MARAVVTPKQNAMLVAFRTFILGMLPDLDVILGQVNRVPEPRSPDFMVYWPLRRERLTTNILSYMDAIAVGSIVGTVLTVTEIIKGVLLPDTLLTDEDLTISANTTIISQLTGTTGGIGTYRVSASQTVVSTEIRAGVRFDTSPQQLVFQVDVHGPSSWDNTQIFSNLFRSIYGVDALAASGLELAPLFCNEPKQLPFINAEDQVEDRWVIEATLQFNPVVSTPQQFADVLEIELIDAVTAYPA